MILVNNLLNFGFENDFYISIQNLITRYPLIWHNILENLIKQDLIVITDNYHIIIFKEKMNSRLRKLYNYIFKILDENKMILNVNENKNFYIITINNPNISRIFYDYDFWLFLVTKKTLDEYNISYSENEFYTNTKISKYITLSINKYNYTIIFNDTTNKYKIDPFFLTLNSRILLITTKELSIKDIISLKYKYQYFVFKEELLQLLMFSL